jgi:hypothetical protein
MTDPHDYADRKWQEALRRHWLAPPDAGFAERLRELADAAEQQQAVFAQAERRGARWESIPNASQIEPPYELRPGTGRRGPAELWASFDAAIARLGAALEGVSLAAIARAFGEIDGAARALSTAVAAEDVAAARGRARRAG